MTFAQSKVEALAIPPTGRIGVVTINWNGWKDTLACLDALRASQRADWHLYIVDNGSTDDSLAHLRELGERVTVIATGVNGGWTGGNNVGIARALASDAEFIFLLNNDAFVEPDTLATLVGAFRSAKGARPPVLGPIHRGSEVASHEFVGADSNQGNGMPDWRKGPIDRTSPELMPTTFIAGAAIFAHRSHFEAVGLLDDRFYLNFDDTDWCTRALRAGFPLLMVRDAAIRHTGSASIGGRASPLQVYFMTRNRLLYAEKHCTLRQRLWVYRSFVETARSLARQTGSPHRVRRMFTNGGAIAAFRLALKDYHLRRFGDCPPEVRMWNRQSKPQS